MISAWGGGTDTVVGISEIVQNYNADSWTLQASGHVLLFNMVLNLLQKREKLRSQGLVICMKSPSQ